jgi:phosphoribosylformimino-5-aminoimidazole carboxamide ribonucleotide (ProFAR) isomerase
VGRDGKLAGPNLTSLSELVDSSRLPVVASGGISNLDDVVEVAKLNPRGVVGVIVGKALYAGKFKLKEALAAWESGVELNVN